MSQPCIAKSRLYFGANPSACEGKMLRIPNFWAYHPSGDLNAYICEKHHRDYGLTYQHKSYLYRRLSGAEAMTTAIMQKPE